MAFFSVAWAQENYEIQVYGSQTQQPSSTIFELHSNYTFQGETGVVHEVRPAFHSLHETVEITHGISDVFEVGFYLFMNNTPTYGYKVVGTHIRPRVMAPARWNLPVGLSLSTEFGYQRPEYSPETWNVEVRPIIDKQFNRLYISFNPTCGIALESKYQNSVPVFEPNVKVSYAFLKNAAIGAEYYGDIGAINAFEVPSQQSHTVFATFDLLNNIQWELNTGIGFGLTPATDPLVAKILIGRRVYWKH
jgi:hypothetical protein